MAHEIGCHSALMALDQWPAQISMGRGDKKKHGNSSTNTVVTPVEPCENLHVRQLLSNGEGRVLLDREVV